MLETEALKDAVSKKW